MFTPLYIKFYNPNLILHKGKLTNLNFVLSLYNKFAPQHTSNSQESPHILVCFCPISWILYPQWTWILLPSVLLESSISWVSNPWPDKWQCLLDITVCSYFKPFPPHVVLCQITLLLTVQVTLLHWIIQQTLFYHNIRHVAAVLEIR